MLPRSRIFIRMALGIALGILMSACLSSKAVTQGDERVSSMYGRLPIRFELNRGQTDGRVNFLARGNGYTLFLTPDEAVLSIHGVLPQSSRSIIQPPGASQASAAIPKPVYSPIRVQLIGSNTNAVAVGEDPLPGKSNYFIGADPSKWRTDVPSFAKVRYHDIYPGIDLLYYGSRKGKLEHDFVVAPGADPSRIQFSLGDSDGCASIVNENLVLRTSSGELTLRAPVVFQESGRKRRNISARYEQSASHEIRIRLGTYDPSVPLVIDPVVVFTALFGGSDDEQPSSIAVNGSGETFVAGRTWSTDYPLANPGPWSSNSAIAVVSKLNASGKALVYSAYFGGFNTAVSGIQVGASGQAYITGYTGGDNFPLKNPAQSVLGGEVDAYMLALSPAGDSLIYSTYLGGMGWDTVAGLALDSSENAYITGNSPGGFPLLHSLKPIPWGIFVAKFDRYGALRYSSIYSYIGVAAAIAVDGAANAYITGYVYVPQYPDGTMVPITKDAFRSTCPASSLCAFVARLNPSGDSLGYSTLLPVGSWGRAIAVDSDSNAYVGAGASPGFPVWSSGFRKTTSDYNDAIVAKVNANGSNLIWSTYLGTGPAIDTLVIDRFRNVYIGGETYSNIPLKAPVQNHVTTGGQGFIMTLNGSLSTIAYYSTYFGPAFVDTGNFYIAVDRALNVYAVGASQGTFKATPGALSTGNSTNPGGKQDNFVSKLVIMDDLQLAMSGSADTVAKGQDLTYTIAVTSKGPDFGYNVRISDTVPAGATFVSYDAGGGSCTSPAVGGTGNLNCVLARLEKGATWNVKLTVHVNAASGTTLSNLAATLSNMQDFYPGNNSGTITTLVR
jgi:uncharacterized repeat protein (TIGR01451 family)